MVSDLENIKSHPEKLLKVHIEGVLNKSETRTASIIAKYAALFHEINFDERYIFEPIHIDDNTSTDIN